VVFCQRSNKVASLTDGWEEVKDCDNGSTMFRWPRPEPPPDCGNQYVDLFHTPLTPLPPEFWEERLAEYQKLMTAATWAELSADLGLPVDVLQLLEIGYNPVIRSYLFPEWIDGRVVGLGTRCSMSWRAEYLRLNGQPMPEPKKFMARGRRGLTLPRGYQDLPDPVYIPEGPSDSLAGRWMGKNCVGRPSNGGGADLVAKLLQGRQVIVLGENDQHTDKTGQVVWPGEKANQVADLIGENGVCVP
jgi:hypothetical protein